VRAYLDVTGISASPQARALLARLWDRMPPRPPSVIHAAVSAELGAPPGERFARWDDEPLAAASLGQVHAAWDADGTAWAVKVQYPGVAETLRDDLQSPALLRRVLGGELGEGVADDALAVLREQLLGELDYQAEARWLDRFRLAFVAERDLVIPRVDPTRSTARVLTMQRLEGQPLATLADADQPTRNRAAAALFRFSFGAPLRHGLFNADPHPGNYLVDYRRPPTGGAPTGGDGNLGFVDFGSCAVLSDELRAAEQRLFLAIIHRDGEALRHAAHVEGLVDDPQTFEGSVWREWEQALCAPFLVRGEVSLRSAAVARLIGLTGELLRARRLALPPGAILLWRQRLGALAVIAGLSPRLPMRRLLAEMLDDGRNPIALYDRWR
jgi:predicted unusual protein kinase regulating ubiquinone biosynthesis (AarF/ABC1/UbiB family)